MPTKATLDDGVEIVSISTSDECAELACVLADVWGFAERSGVASQDTLRAMAHSGSYVAGVRFHGRLIGGGFGWPTHVDGEWRLHSHVIGFLDGFRALGLGFRIKHHQRDFVRAAGLAAIEWTFDPLHAVNARFNLFKLGARVESFHRDFYGELKDNFSAGLGSDRFVVRWGVDDVPPALPTDVYEPMLVVGANDEPLVRNATSSRVSAQLPANIVEMRRVDKTRALEWREAFAGTVGAAVNAGGKVAAIDGERRYLIDRA